MRVDQVGRGFIRFEGATADLAHRSPSARIVRRCICQGSRLRAPSRASDELSMEVDRPFRLRMIGV